MIKTYTELIRLPTFEERFEYLRLNGIVGESTFGFDRWINQEFYRSKHWKQRRDEIIIRDNGCDLGIMGYEITRKIIIHHINPIRVYDILDNLDFVMDPNLLICTSENTHNAIHFRSVALWQREPIVRKQFDTCPWKA